MKSVRNAIEDYIALRRSLGFKLHGMATGLGKFASFLEQKEAPYITTALALEWAMQPLTIHQAIGLSDWVSFACSLAIGAQPIRAPKFRPPVYSHFERGEPVLIFTPNRRFRACWQRPEALPLQGLRPRTYHCLFGLLAVRAPYQRGDQAGAVDVDLDEDLLTIRQTKFGKTRLIPLHTSLERPGPLRPAS